MKHKKNIGHHLFLASYCIIVVIPFIWLILGALKTKQEWMVNPEGLTKYFAIENFFFEGIERPYFGILGPSEGS